MRPYSPDLPPIATSCCEYRNTREGALALSVPDHFLTGFAACEPPRDHEQQIGQAVEVAQYLRPHVGGVRERLHPALGAADNGARQMAGGGGAAAAGQDEVFQRRQIRVEGVELRLQAVDEGGRHRGMSRDAQFAAQLEQLVLHRGEHAADRFLDNGLGEHGADRAVGFIHGAVGFDASVALWHAAAVTQSGCAVIARSRVDFAEPVAHDAAR